MIELGTKARSSIQSCIAGDTEVAKFRLYCGKCFVEAASYLEINLPFSNKILEYFQYLHPEKQNNSLSLDSISNLILKIANIFGIRLIYLMFNLIKSQLGMLIL